LVRVLDSDGRLQDLRGLHSADANVRELPVCVPEEACRSPRGTQVLMWKEADGEDFNGTFVLQEVDTLEALQQEGSCFGSPAAFKVTGA